MNARCSTSVRAEKVHAWTGSEGVYHSKCEAIVAMAHLLTVTTEPADCIACRVVEDHEERTLALVEGREEYA